jgi:hypothetical protein
MDAEKLRIAREKLTRVFRYLEALNQHRNPAKRQIREQPWNLHLRELPEHPSIQRGTGRASSAKTRSGGSPSSEEACANYVLKAQRPRLSRPPEPPGEIAAWLEEGWDDPSNAVAVEETLEESDNRAEPRIAKFADDPARTASLGTLEAPARRMVENRKARSRGDENLRDILRRHAGRAALAEQS